MSGSAAAGAGSEHQVPGPGPGLGPGPGPGPDCRCPPLESHAWWPSCSPRGRSWQSWPLRERWPGGKSQPPQLRSGGKRGRTRARGTQAGDLGVPLRPLHNQEFDMTSPSIHGIRSSLERRCRLILHKTWHISVTVSQDTNLLLERSNSYVFPLCFWVFFMRHRRGNSPLTLSRPISGACHFGPRQSLTT